MNERMKSIVKSPAFAPAVSGVVSLSVGAVVGYILGRRHEAKLAETYDVPEDVIDVTKLRAEREKREGIKGHPATTAIIDEKTYGDGTAIEDDDPKITEEEKRMIGHVEENMTITIAEHVEDDEPEAPVRRTIFAQDGPDWNMAQELASRYSGKPYVLHHDEFYEENEDFDFPQVTYTWFEGDQIMVDQEDDIVPDVIWKERIGELQFGKGAQDPNVFHIRNEKQKIDIEVLRSTDYYARAIQGLEIEEEAEAHELQHSSGPRRMRRE